MESQFIVSAAEYAEDSQINFFTSEEKGIILTNDIVVKQLAVSRGETFPVGLWLPLHLFEKVKGKMQ